MKRDRLFLRGVRGAIQIRKNDKEEILKKTIQLLKRIMQENGIEKDDIVSIFFTVTNDINKEFPAYALRQMGLKYVPALCAREIDVPNAMKRVIRVLMHFYSSLNQKKIKHQYLGNTRILRPDLSGERDDNSNEA